MNAVTQWFPPNEKPSRVGEYEIFQVGMRFWSGVYWVHPSGLLIEPLNPWRGLAAKPQPDQPAQEVDK